MSTQKKYDSMVVRIAGNLLSGVLSVDHLRAAEYGTVDPAIVKGAVMFARAIVAEVERTQPTTEVADAPDR
jgi:hypothetical protein